MYRHGLIFILAFYFLFLPSSYPKDGQTKYLKDFSEGLRLFAAKDYKGAYWRFKRSRSQHFILSDYADLYMAYSLKDGSRPDKALARIEKAGSSMPQSPFLKRLLGEIYLDLERYDEAFDSFSDHYTQSRDYRDGITFLRFSEAFSRSSHRERSFTMYLIRFFKTNRWIMRPGSTDLIEDVLLAYSGEKNLADMYNSLGSPRTALGTLRSAMLWSEGKNLPEMVQIAQRLKDYRLKVKLLKELLKVAKDGKARAKLEFEIALSYLNMDEESRSLRYFLRSSSNGKGDLVSIKADYYCGRIWEFRGDLRKAAEYYRKAKGRRYTGSEERDLIIKSMSRSGWVNYKSKRYLSALKDYKYLVDRFGTQVSEDGYVYWYGMSLKRLGRLGDARTVFEYFYIDHPLSYYAILGALEIKRMYGEEIMTPHAESDCTGPVDPDKARLIDRALMLLALGLHGPSNYEMTRYRIDYNNTSEIVLAAIAYDLLENHKRSLALVDFVINQRKGMPGRDILKLYYPVRYYNFISHESEKKGVDPFMIFSLLRQESAFDPMAVSPAGAKGLMQVLPSLGLKTAKELNLGDIEEEDLHFPRYNLKIGIDHFAELYSKFGKNIALAASAYNSSESKVLRWKKKYGFKSTEEFIEDIPYFETRNYAKMIIRNYVNYLRIYGRDWREALKGGL